MSAEIYLIRHGETAWSLSGQHTSATDLALTPRGEDKARALRSRLAGVAFVRVLTSPLKRARQTCQLSGLAQGEIDPDLTEWNYGEYEGKTSAEIETVRPGWNLFRDGCPGGESTAQITARADRCVARFRAWEGPAAVFSHGHFLRVLAARWACWPVLAAERLQLDTGSISILSFEHARRDRPVLRGWNLAG